MKENNEKKMKNEDEISKLIKAFPKDIAALDKRSVLAKVNSQGSGTQKPVQKAECKKDRSTKRKSQKIMNEKMSKRRIQKKEN